MSTRLAKMLELAAYPTTTEHEAVGALRKAREHLDRSGQTITSPLMEKSAPSALAVNLFEAVKQTTILEGIVDELRKEKAAADGKIGRLRAHRTVCAM